MYIHLNGKTDRQTERDMQFNLSEEKRVLPGCDKSFVSLNGVDEKNSAVLWQQICHTGGKGRGENSENKRLIGKESMVGKTKRNAH